MSLFLISLLVAFAGVVWSVVSPADFEVLAQATEKRSYEHGRALGLYLQPNVAAHVMTAIVLMIVLASIRSGKWAIALLGMVAYIPAILLTGSRAGVLLAVLIVAYMIFSPTFRSVHGMRERLAHVIIKRTTLLFLVAAMLLALFVLPDGLQLSERGGVVDRVGQVLGLGVGDSEVEDALAQSDRLRLHAAREHIDNTRGVHRFLGNGIGASQAFRDEKMITTASHNQFVEWYFSYGLIGLLILIGMFAYILWIMSKMGVMKVSKYHYVLLFSILMMATTSNTVFDYRPLYIMFGYLAFMVIEDRWMRRSSRSTKDLAEVA